LADGVHMATPTEYVEISTLRDLPQRGRIACSGFIESVTYEPASEKASFSAMVTDTVEEWRRSPIHERLRVVWLGRRRVPGIEAGARLRLEGMVTMRDGLHTMFNPRYEILSRQENP
jgi:hypothetical protein